MTNIPRIHVNRAQHQSGSTLVEVMIAVFILAVGLLGVAALQASALRNSGSALERSQAVIQTYSILDAMRANNPSGINAARIGGYNVALGAASGGNALATSDLVAWQASLQATLGASAQGGINCVAAVCTITAQWNDSRGTRANTSAAATAAASYQVITVSQL